MRKMNEGDVSGVTNVKTVTDVNNVKNGEIVAKVFDDGLALVLHIVRDVHMAWGSVREKSECH